VSAPLGFIGLGALGRAVAQRLAATGSPLLVWNRTPGRAAGLDAEEASSPAEVVTRAETVVLCLRDSEAVWAVTSGPGGLFAGDCRGRTLIDLTTNHVDVATVLHGLAAKAGAAWVEAPVLGSVVPASRGELVVLASGEAAALERARPVLERIGSRVVHLGAPGAATAMKLANNLVLAALLAGLAEGTAVAEAAGIPRATALDVLGAGAGSSAVLAGKRAKVLAEDYEPHFSAALLYKDLHYLQDLARTLRRPVPLAAAIKELVALAFPAGLGERDVAVLFPLLRDLGRPAVPPGDGRP
jgi:3-hydroxyisobutyrate dehydrogenase